MKMTSLERFLAAVRFEEVDRMPTDLHNFSLCASTSGKTFDRFVLDPELMARRQIALWEEFGHDVLLVENGTASLAQAMGCGVSFRKEDAPAVTGAVLKAIGEWDKLTVTGKILDAPLLRANLETVKLLRKKLGHQVAIMGRGDQGPFSLASQMLGMSRLLMELTDRDMAEDIAHLMEIAAQAGILCCTAMLEAGAHCTSIGDSTAGPDVISPAMYEAYAFPYERKLIRAVHREGGLIALHICGNATGIIGKMTETEADILEIDQKTRLAESWPGLKGRTAILGQISPVTLMNGGTEEVRAETETMLRTVGGRKVTGVILGPGCALGGGTPFANIHVMLDAVKNKGGREIVE